MSLRIPIFMALFALAMLSPPAAAFDSYAFPRGVVVKGDSTAALIQRGGRPDRVVTLENHRVLA
ncbi:hypothetical protein ACW7GZ_05625 [Luteimonas sp. A537]